MERKRVLAAGLIVLVMLALQWPLWLGSAVEPIVFGMPVQFAYFLGYAALSSLAIWAVFRLIWPAKSDRPDAGSLAKNLP